jgi:hypothetical protein
MKSSENGDSLKGLSIRSERLLYSIMPVQEGLYVVLMLDDTGIPSQGMKALKDAVREIAALI